MRRRVAVLLLVLTALYSVWPVTVTWADSVGSDTAAFCDGSFDTLGPSLPEDNPGSGSSPCWNYVNAWSSSDAVVDDQALRFPYVLLGDSSKSPDVGKLTQYFSHDAGVTVHITVQGFRADAVASVFLNGSATALATYAGQTMQNLAVHVVAAYHPDFLDIQGLDVEVGSVWLTEDTPTPAPTWTPSSTPSEVPSVTPCSTPVNVVSCGLGEGSWQDQFPTSTPTAAPPTSTPNATLTAIRATQTAVAGRTATAAANNTATAYPCVQPSPTPSGTSPTPTPVTCGVQLGDSTPQAGGSPTPAGSSCGIIQDCLFQMGLPVSNPYWVDQAGAFGWQTCAASGVCEFSSHQAIFHLDGSAEPGFRQDLPCNPNAYTPAGCDMAVQVWVRVSSAAFNTALALSVSDDFGGYTAHCTVGGAGNAVYSGWALETCGGEPSGLGTQQFNVGVSGGPATVYLFAPCGANLSAGQSLASVCGSVPSPCPAGATSCASDGSDPMPSATPPPATATQDSGLATVEAYPTDTPAAAAASPTATGTAGGTGGSGPDYTGPLDGIMNAVTTGAHNTFNAIANLPGAIGQLFIPQNLSGDFSPMVSAFQQKVQVPGLDLSAFQQPDRCAYFGVQGLTVGSVDGHSAGSRISVGVNGCAAPWSSIFPWFRTVLTFAFVAAFIAWLWRYAHSLVTAGEGGNVAE